jgi:hypothetical protein
MIGISPFSSSILLFGQSGGTPVDPDAQAFITAAAITNPTQQSAVNQLVVDLKGYGVWSKMKALYPFVGGTASQHKFNLKDPRDLDAAFRLVFNGGWTHSSTGALPNGTNAFADTKLNAFTLPLNQNSTSFSAYSRTQTAPSNQMIIGTVSGGYTGMSFIQCNVTGGAGATGIGVYSTSTGVVNNNTTTYTDLNGYFQIENFADTNNLKLDLISYEQEKIVVVSNKTANFTEK